MNFKMKTCFYAGYGSNLNIEQMKSRCPKSKLISKSVILDWTLVFRGVADIICKKNSKLNIGIYKITEECEKSLDKYEGFPKLYNKKYFKIQLNEKEEDVLTYVMNPKYSLGPPCERYFKLIVEGFKSWKLDKKFLFDAVSFSINNRSNFTYKPDHFSESPIINETTALKLLK